MLCLECSVWGGLSVFKQEKASNDKDEELVTVFKKFAEICKVGME